MTTTTSKPVAPQTVPPLPADLDLALRRLKLASIRRSAPQVLLTAKTQRWTPEEVLRTLVEAEIAARDASNIRNRLKTAGFPVTKTLESFDVAASSIPANTFDYLSSLEWVRAQHNLALIGPAGTGKSHTLIGLGIAAVHAGHKVRYFTAVDLVETLYRGLADNTVGKTIDTLLRQDLIILDEIGFAPLDDTGTQLLFRLVAGAYERRSLAIASHWPFEQWGRFLPEHTTAASILDRLLHHATIVITDGDSYRMTHRTEVPPTYEHPAQGGDFHLATSGDIKLAVDIRRSPRQLVLAELVADGRASETAAVFQLGTDTVRKCVSRVFVTARVRNRTEPVRLIRRPRT